MRLLTAAFLILISSNLFAETNKIDNRISLGLTESEKTEFLKEMRQMLSSIQDIIIGIGENNPERIVQAAKASGGKMARSTPQSITQKLPKAFKELGGPTHMMFEELALNADIEDLDSLALYTGKIIQQCTACHDSFKAN